MRNQLYSLAGKNIFVLSPHFDDALLSCFSLISKLAKKNNITIVNVFTKAHTGPYTWSAKKFLQLSGMPNNAVKLFEARTIEDKEATSNLGVISVTNLGFQDALFRRSTKNTLLGNIIPELNHLYPTYRWHILNKPSATDPVSLKLKKKLVKLVDSNDLVIAPYGIGKHVDHLLVRKVSQELFPNLILYADFPYSQREEFYGNLPPDFNKITIKPNLVQKEKVLKQYTTQYSGLFPTKRLESHNEVFYIRGRL